jgi:hypothetical protein
MRIVPRAIGLLIAASAAVAAPAVAQNERTPEGERGTELAVLAGVAATSNDTGPMAGAVVEWRMSRRISVEARAAWLDRGPGADAFTADVGGVVNLIPQQTITPLVGVGFGLYRAAFDGSVPAMPEFYRRRAGAGGGPPAGGWSFVDPVLRTTAGVDMHLGRRLSLRPEASALFIRRDGRGKTVGTFSVRVGYRFEDRPITPTR